jgi:hypothetical protein
MTDTTTDTTTDTPAVAPMTTQEVLADIAAKTAAITAPSEAEVAAAIDKAQTAFAAAGQPNVIAGLVRGMQPRPTSGRGQNVPAGSDGGSRTPVQMAEMISVEQRADFLTRLSALVAGLNR